MKLKYKFRNWCRRHLPRWMMTTLDIYGIEFQYKGDIVIYTWPWKDRDIRKSHGKYISVTASGTGQFGDARFHTLVDVTTVWE